MFSLCFQKSDYDNFDLPTVCRSSLCCVHVHIAYVARTACGTLTVGRECREENRAADNRSERTALLSSAYISCSVSNAVVVTASFEELTDWMTAYWPATLCCAVPNQLCITQPRNHGAKADTPHHTPVNGPVLGTDFDASHYHPICISWRQTTVQAHTRTPRSVA